MNIHNICIFLQAWQGCPKPGVPHYDLMHLRSLFYSVILLSEGFAVP